MDASSVTSVGENQQESEPHEDQVHPDEAGAAQLTAALSSKQRVALDALLLPNASVPDAAKKAGVHRGTVNRWVLEDANFIAAFNARTLEMVMVSNARVLGLIPKAMEAIENAIDNGDARIAMQLLKIALLTPVKSLATSSALVTEQLKAAAQEQRVQVSKQQVDLAILDEQTILAKKKVDLERAVRLSNEKPFLEQYEQTRLFYHQGCANGRAQKAKMQEIDARVAAAVAKSTSGLMNPGGDVVDEGGVAQR